MHTARANSERTVGLVVAAVLLLDLLAFRMRGSWKAVAVVAVAVALLLVLRAWLRRPRVAPRPAEHAEDAPPFVMGAPHIDGRLWSKVEGAVRVECALRQMAAMAPVTRIEPVTAYLIEHSSWTPLAAASETHGDEWQDEPLELCRPRKSHRAFVEAPPPSATRERRPYRRAAAA
jgi:hypothetical protein